MLLYQPDAELLFPARLIPTLRDLRGHDFRMLIDRLVECESESTVEVLGFSLLMVRLSSCLTCTADSYRAMNGCTRCVHKVIRGFKGSDEELIQLWETACTDVIEWQERGLPPKDL
ncbi:MAG: hypothetical protein KJ064_00110 [Anaerolineae bacterium]|jgi:hypothetical protein|nr:hypothetical protein [Anaerolineae bacterium]